MAIQLGDIAPDFTADSTEGEITLLRLPRRRLGHPVLAPEGLHPGLHHRARRGRPAEGRVRRRNTKVLGVSVDPVDSHEGWKDDIKDATGYRRSTTRCSPTPTARSPTSTG